MPLYMMMSLRSMLLANKDDCGSIVG